MIYHNRAIQSLIERTQVQSIKHLCQSPTTQAVHRICVYHANGQAYHSVATLVCGVNEREHVLEIVYDGLFDYKPLSKTILDDDYQDFVKMLRKARFDSLHEQADIFVERRTIWCIERAAGGLYHQVLLSPDKPEMPYNLIINAIADHIPQAIRTIKK